MREIKTEHLSPPSDVYRLYEFLKELDSVFQPKLSERVDIKHYAEKLSEHAELFYVSADGRDVANCAVYMNQNTTCFISSFAVAKNMQREGIGTRLMQAVISEGSKKNMKAIELDVHVCNHAGIHFYTSQGFQKKTQQGEWVEMYRKLN